MFHARVSNGCACACPPSKHAFIDALLLIRARNGPAPGHGPRAPSSSWPKERERPPPAILFFRIRSSVSWLSSGKWVVLFIDKSGYALERFRCEPFKLRHMPMCMSKHASINGPGGPLLVPGPDCPRLTVAHTDTPPAHISIRMHARLYICLHTLWSKVTPINGPRCNRALHVRTLVAYGTLRRPRRRARKKKRCGRGAGRDPKLFDVGGADEREGRWQDGRRQGRDGRGRRRREGSEVAHRRRRRRRQDDREHPPATSRSAVSRDHADGVRRGTPWPIRMCPRDREIFPMPPSRFALALGVRRRHCPEELPKIDERPRRRAARQSVTQ